MLESVSECLRVHDNAWECLRVIESAREFLRVLQSAKESLKVMCTINKMLAKNETMTLLINDLQIFIFLDQPKDSGQRFLFCIRSGTKEYREWDKSMRSGLRVQ